MFNKKSGESFYVTKPWELESDKALPEFQRDCRGRSQTQWGELYQHQLWFRGARFDYFHTKTNHNKQILNVWKPKWSGIRQIQQ